MVNERKLTGKELNQREKVMHALRNNKNEFVKRYGINAEKIIYGLATKKAKEKIKNMNPKNLKELIQDALKNPKKADLNKDGKLSPYEKKRGEAIEKNMNEQSTQESGLIIKGRTDLDSIDIKRTLENSDLYYEWDSIEKYFFLPEEESMYNSLETELDKLLSQTEANYYIEGIFNENINENDVVHIGHKDNELDGLKKDLYRIIKYSKDLYDMMSSYSSLGENVDLPHWIQSKIVQSKTHLISVKHYLDGEEKIAQIDSTLDRENETMGIEIGEGAINSDYKRVYSILTKQFPDLVDINNNNKHNWNLIKSFVDDEINNIEITDSQDIISKFEEYRKNKFRGVIGKMVGRKD